ncbi:MAG: glycosyltransferase [Gemmataceae bacterium]
MLKILFVIPSLEYGGAAKQLILLATHLPRDRFLPTVCVLSTAGPWLEGLRKAGVACEILRWTRAIDPQALLRLRKSIQIKNPNVIHAWTGPALRASWAASLGTGCPVIASDCLRSERRPSLASIFQSWILKRAKKVVASNSAQVRASTNIGVKPQNLLTIPPAVDVSNCFLHQSPSLRQKLGISEKARLLGCIGPLTMPKGNREAIWALDILHYLYDDIHLILVGEGPDRHRLERFARATEATRRVHFLGPQPDVASLLAELDLVWIPALADVGTNVLLETMAAGKPFVATRWPGLSEFIPKEGQECLVPPGDKAALARQAHRLLSHPERSRRLGEMGRQHVRDSYSVAALSNAFADAYAAVAR